jgi:signal transduction histidine kinase
MERRRRLTSLRSVLLRYLCLCGGGCVLLLMIWWVIFMQLIDNGFLLSATASAQACANAREVVAAMTVDTFDADAIDSLCRYAVVTSANTAGETVHTTNMTAHQLKTALNDLHGGSGNLWMMQYQYIVTMADGATCLLQYDYAVPYADPALRERLPDFQTCYIILLVVLVLAWLAVTTHRTVRTFTAETSRIDEATRQIAAQHPEAVDVDHARIREFSATLQALQTMGQQLTDSLQRQWQLEQQRTEQVAALAHDLKTPLTIIQGNAELLAETAPAPELDAILRAGVRAQQYLAALRSAGTVPAARQLTDSHTLAAALADTAQALCRPAKLHFVLQEQWQGQFLCAAPELSRALENMLDNAVRYTPAGGTVTLDVSKAEDMLVFTVTDTGPGFTPEALHKAGQFLYTDAARPCNGHQGLGLYLARSVAQAYGGKLVLANTGIGAQAQLCLPMQ